MQTKLLVPGLALALLLAPGAAAAPPDKPPKTPSAITLDAKPAIVVFSGATTLSGRVTGAKAGVTVRLEQDDTRPYGDSYSRSPARRRPRTTAATRSPSSPW